MRLRRAAGEVLAHLVARFGGPLPDLILCYHRPVDRPGRCYDPFQEVTLSTLERQLTHLLRTHEPVELHDWLSGHGPGRPALAVTFDDARREVLAAAPLMERLGIPPALFVPTAVLRGEALWFDVVADKVSRWGGERGFVTANPGLPTRHGAAAVVKAMATLPMVEIRAILERWRPWPADLGAPYLDPDELLGLQRGGWTIGSHTVHHPWLPSEPDHVVSGELEQSREDLGRLLGRRPDLVAYPGGGFDRRVLRLAGDAGYAWGLTVQRGASSWPMAVDRINVSSVTSRGALHDFCGRRFEAELSGWLDRLRRGLSRG